MNNEEVLLIFKRQKFKKEFSYLHITNNKINVRQILKKCHQQIYQQNIIIVITKSLGAPPGPDF